MQRVIDKLQHLVSGSPEVALVILGMIEGLLDD